jgi:lysophospholipase L1-like esterase
VVQGKCARIITALPGPYGVIVRISRVILTTAVAVTTAGLVTAASVLPAAGAASSVSYVALGDSYSSGLGAGPYISSSGSCDRSTNAYPEQWAAANSPASFVSVACAGATTSDVIGSQVTALSAATTLVSITIGGNDAGFSGVMQTCVLKSTSSCLSAVATAKSVVTSQLPASLASTLHAIRQRAPGARIVVLGYPDLYDLTKSGSCIGLSTQDRTALNSGAEALDSALLMAVKTAADPGIVYADVRGQFATHEICDSGRWLHSVDLLAISSSYHPTTSGQKLGYQPVFSRNTG